MSELSFEACRQGIELTIQNALRLRDDALENSANGRPYTAALLGCYAFDEFGKALIVAKTMIHAKKAGEASVSTANLKELGFFHHGSKLSSISQLWAPIMTGLPPGHSLTANAISKLEQRVWKIRNAVAYVDIVNDEFKSPTTAISGQQCDDVVQMLSEMGEFMETHGKPYLLGL